MTMNFCDPSLLPQVACSTISTENHEPTNLTTGNDNGFLAYSSIRPPVHIDFTFICKIKISHIFIWPCVGSQKSSGFRISSIMEHDDLSTAFLQPSESGVFFYRRDSHFSKIPVPENFLRRYIKVARNQFVNSTDNLRISIVKTENSVPALSRVEIWGEVAEGCDDGTKKTVMKLWEKKNVTHVTREIVENCNEDKNNRLEESKSLSFVPEDFLDPITCEIMTRPIVLPSGKIIDQVTLERHEKTEANWGRRLSDPFTGMIFSDKRKPVVAFALKERIDKFLLENSDVEEIRKMPRVLGTKNARSGVNFLSGASVFREPPLERIDASKKQSHKLPFCTLQQPKRKFRGGFSRIVEKKKKVERDEGELLADKRGDNGVIGESNLEESIRKALLGQKCFSEPGVESEKSQKVDFSCNCCSNKVLYKLPCEHIVCRKMLLDSKDNKCGICEKVYCKSEPIRTFL